MAGGFFAQALVDAGAGIRGYQQQQLVDQQIQSNQQNLAMNKMALMAQQKHQAAQEDVSTYMSAQLEKDKSIMSDPVKMAQLQEQSATQAYKDGDFQLGAGMASAAKQSYVEAKAAIAQKVAEKAQATKDLSQTAYEFGAGDVTSPEAQKELVQKAIAAGVNPTTIPLPSEPVKFKAWAQKMENAASTAEQRSTFVQNQHKEEIAEDDRKQRIKDNERAESDRESDKALSRQLSEEHMAQLKEAKALRASSALPKTMEKGDYSYIPDPEHRYTGPRLDETPGSVGYDYVQSGPRKLTAVEKSGTSRAVASASEIGRNVENMLSFKDASLTPFGHIQGDTLLKALERTGTTAMTPDQTLAYSKSVAGLGVETGNLLSSLGGRTPNLSIMNEIQNMASRESGMSSVVGLYGAANVVDIARTYLKALPLSESNPKVQEQLKRLENFPKPEEIAAIINARGDKKAQKQMQKLQNAASADRNTADSSATAPPPVSSGLPPGVTQVN